MIKGIIARTVNRLLKPLGARLEPFDASNSVPPYYLANAHKKIDIRTIPNFSEAAGRVIAEGSTLLDYDRLYTLWQLASSAPKDTLVVEVGVFKGGSTSMIAETLERLGKTNSILAFDTFQGHAVVDPTFDTVHQVGDFNEVSLELVQKYLSPWSRVSIHEGDFMETSKVITELDALPVGFAHIDVDVYPVTKYCLEFFGPRLVVGGAVVVDDYGVSTCPGVVTAVDDFAAAHAEFRVLHLITGQAVLIKTAAGDSAH